MINDDPKSLDHQYVRFQIVNTGERPINIVQIGWTAGWFIKSLGAKKIALQMFEPAISDNLPKTIAYGEQAAWMFPLRDDDRDWISHFAANFLTPNRWLMLRTLKAHAYTSTGQRFDARPGQSLLGQFKKATS